LTLQGYLAHRRYWEVAALLLVFSLYFILSTATTLIDMTRSGSSVESWEVICWELTSHVAIAVVLPLLLWFDNRFPVRPDTWRRNLPLHLVFTLPWSLAHVTLMYWLRVLTYYLVGKTSYEWKNWWGDFAYEYMKDSRTYILLLSIIYLYRFVLLRLQGEAGFVSEGSEDTAPVNVADRFLIKKLGREFLVRVSDIDWIEASGNYVNLHVGTRVYPLRETMAGISARLEPLGFQRVHRGAIVNLDRVAEIRPQDSGDAEALLTSSTTVPVSRRFRKDLRERLA
jgi:hypothetical protein